MKYLKTYNIILLVLSITCISLYIYSRYDHERQLILSSIDEVLGQAAQSVKYILPDNFHHKIKDSIDISADAKNIQRLTDFARERNIWFVYSLAQDGTNIIFTSSSLNTNTTIENPEIRYGFIYSEASATLRSAFNKTGFTHEVSTDRWGESYSVYYTREEGNHKWVAGAEYRKDLFDSRLKTAILEAIFDVLYIATFIGVLFLPVYFKLRRRNIAYHNEIQNLRKFYNGMSRGK